jgi:hypothetical protein
MIAELRRVHRFSSVALAVAVPVVFAAAIGARPDAPVNASLPSVAHDPYARATHPLAWSRPDIRAELVLAADDSSTVSIDASSLAVEPTVLVYWLETGETSEPPAAGRLLGAVRGTGPQTIALPAGAALRGGSVALYSLAHEEVVATAMIAAQGGPS